MPQSGTRRTRPRPGLRVAFEQLQAVLELRDAQREIVDFGLLGNSESPDDAIHNILATHAEPVALVTPSGQRVAHGSTHRVAIDAHPLREIVSQPIGTFNRQRCPAERSEQRLLQRATRGTIRRALSHQET